MYINDYVAQQIARDKEAEMRQYMQANPDMPRRRRGAWLIGFFVVALASAGYFIR
jgi:hypothetical protein